MRMQYGLEPIQRRKVDALAEDPRPDGVKQLHDEERLYRVRVGDYRIIYQIRDDRLLVVIVRVRHRKDAYRREFLIGNVCRTPDATAVI